MNDACFAFVSSFLFVYYSSFHMQNTKEFQSTNNIQMFLVADLREVGLSDEH